MFYTVTATYRDTANTSTVGFEQAYDAIEYARSLWAHYLASWVSVRDLGSDEVIYCQGI